MLSAQFIIDLINPGNTNIQPGLERMKLILTLLGNPQDKYKVIHITGTNGKGSTAAFLECGLIHAGYKVGKFTSPYIHRINECIVLNYTQITDTDLELIYVKLKKLLTIHNFHLSPFEFLTAIMFEYFAAQAIEWLILEVGMGGENDSTNVVNSKYSIITNVELEHQKWLGDTIAAIAKEKSGIIKHGLTIIADNKVEVKQAIKAKTNNYINVLDKYFLVVDLNSESFLTNIVIQPKNSICDQSESYGLGLFGKFQAYNFLCAYAIFKDMKLTVASISYAAKQTKWIGRLQVISTDPLIIVDATHNVAGAKNLVETLNAIYAVDEIVVITSILRDKDIPAMLTYFSQLTSCVVYTSIDNNPRGMTADELIQFGTSLFDKQFSINDPLEALSFAKKLNKKVILITGSLYLLSYFL